MKITVTQWIEIIKLLSTFLIGVLTTLTMQSCSASMSIFGKIVINNPSKKPLKRLLLGLIV